jgi:hypothetical protein
MSNANEIRVIYETVSLDEAEKNFLLQALRELLEVTETDPRDYDHPDLYGVVLENAQRRARCALKMLSAS